MHTNVVQLTIMRCTIGTILLLIQFLALPLSTTVNALEWDRTIPELSPRSDFAARFVPITAACNTTFSNPNNEPTTTDTNLLCRTIDLMANSNSTTILIAFGGVVRATNTAINDISITLWPIPAVQSPQAGARQGWMSLTNAVGAVSAFPRVFGPSAWVPSFPQLVWMYQEFYKATSLWFFDVSDISFHTLGPMPPVPDDFVNITTATSEATSLIAIPTYYVEDAKQDVRDRCLWPAPTYGRSMVVVQNSLLLWGGLDDNDLWILTLNQTIVDLIKLQNGPGKYERGYIYDTSITSQCVPWRKWVQRPWPASCATPVTAQLPLPTARMQHAASSNDHSMYILGGHGVDSSNSSIQFADFWVFRLPSGVSDPMLGSWREITLVAAPSLTGFSRRISSTIVMFQSQSGLAVVGGTYDGPFVTQPFVTNIVVLGSIALMEESITAREAVAPDSFLCDAITAGIPNSVTMMFQSSVNLTLNEGVEGTLFSAAVSTPVECHLQQHLWIGVTYTSVNGLNATQDTNFIQSYSEYTGVATRHAEGKPHWGPAKLAAKNMIPPRRDHGATTIGDILWIYGGIGVGDQVLADMWTYTLSTDTWEEIIPVGSVAPPSLTQFSFTAHEPTKMIWLYGGNCKGYTDLPAATDIYSFDTVVRRWSLNQTTSHVIYNVTSLTPMDWQAKVPGYNRIMESLGIQIGIPRFDLTVPIVMPFQRYAFPARIVGDELIVHGGACSDRLDFSLADSWALNLRTLIWRVVWFAPAEFSFFGYNDLWTDLMADLAPEFRHSHIMEVISATTFVLGLGSRYSINTQYVSAYSDLWTFDLLAQKYTLLVSTTSAIPSLFRASAVVLNNRVYVFGGQRESSVFSSSLWVYDLLLNRWTLLSNPTVGGIGPTGRAGASFNRISLGATECGLMFAGVTSDFDEETRSTISNELHLLTDDQIDVGSAIGSDILSYFSFPLPVAPKQSELIGILQTHLSSNQLQGFSTTVSGVTSKYFSLPAARLAPSISMFQITDIQPSLLGSFQFNVLPTSSTSNDIVVQSSIPLHRSLMSHMETTTITEPLRMLGEGNTLTRTPQLHCFGSCFLIARNPAFTGLVQIRNFELVGKNLSMEVISIPSTAKSQVGGQGYSAVTIDSGSSVALVDTRLVGHREGWFGSAITVVASELYLLRVNVSDCSSSLNGGSIWGVTSTVTILDSFFDHNSVATAFDNRAMLDQMDADHFSFIGTVYRSKQCTLNAFDLETKLTTSNASTAAFPVGFLSCFGWGGSIHLLASSLNISNSDFRSNSALFGGSIALDSALPVLFSECNGLKSATSLMFSGCLFSNNFAEKGGAVMLNEFPWDGNTLADAIFTQNTALYGILYSYNGPDLNCTRLTFINNTVQAGQIFWTANADRLLDSGQNQQNPPVLSNITAIDNTYQYGPIIAGVPMNIAFVDEDGKRMPAPANYEPVHSGISDTLPIVRIGLFDLHGQLVRTEDTVFIAAAPATQLGGVPVVQVLGGIAVFSALQLLLYPLQQTKLTFTASITLPLYNQSDTTLPLLSSGCVPGEFVNVNRCQLCPAGRYSNISMANSCIPCLPGYYQGSDNSTECFPCAQGRMSPRSGETECAICPVETMSWVSASTECQPCKNGLLCSNATAVPISGYWLTRTKGRRGGASGRAEVAEVTTPTGTEYIYAIPCPGDNCSGNRGECNTNRVNPPDTNALCAACLPGYTEVDGSCVRCDRPNGGLIFGAILMAIVIALVVYQLANTSTREPSNNERMIERGRERGSEAMIEKQRWYQTLFLLDCSDEVISILSFFVQTFTFEVGSISSANDWMRLVGLNLTAVSSSSCFFPTDAYGNLALNISAPFFIIVILALGMGLHRALWFPAVLSRFAMRRSKMTATIKSEIDAKLRKHERKVSALASGESESKFDRDLAQLRLKSAKIQDSSANEFDGVGKTEVLVIDHADVTDTESAVRMTSLKDDPFVFALFGNTLPVRIYVPMFSMDRYWRSFSLLCILLYQPICVTVISHLNCAIIGDRTLVFSSATMDCNSSTYKYHVLPLLAILTVIWVAGLPALVVLLWYRRKKLFSQSSQVEGVAEQKLVFERRFAHLYSRYQPNVPWWTAVILLRTVMILVADLVMFSMPQYKLVSFTNFNAFLLCVHLWVMPYASKLPNILESITLTSLTFLNAISLSEISYYHLPGSGSSVKANAYTPNVTILMIFLTLPIVIALILIIVRLKWPSIARDVRGMIYQVGKWYRRRRGKAAELKKQLDELQSKHVTAKRDSQLPSRPMKGISNSRLSSSSHPIGSNQQFSSDDDVQGNPLYDFLESEVAERKLRAESLLQHQLSLTQSHNGLGRMDRSDTIELGPIQVRNANSVFQERRESTADNIRDLNAASSSSATNLHRPSPITRRRESTLTERTNGSNNSNGPRDSTFQLQHDSVIEEVDEPDMDEETVAPRRSSTIMTDDPLRPSTPSAIDSIINSPSKQDESQQPPPPPDYPVPVTSPRRIRRDSYIVSGIEVELPTEPEHENDAHMDSPDSHNGRSNSNTSSLPASSPTQRDLSID